MDLELDKKQESLFLKFYNGIINRCDKNEIEKFCSDPNINTDIKRFEFVSEFKAIKNYHFDFDDVLRKNNLTADGLKSRGNLAFQDKNMELALHNYNEALLTIPTENVEVFSILLANRSAVLFRLKEYKLAIKDIEMASNYYPIAKMYKIKERLAKCYSNIEDFHNSLKAYKEFIACLEVSALPSNERIESEICARMMVKIIQTGDIDTSLEKLSIKEDVGNMKNKLNDSVEFEYSPSKGYFAKANNEIKIGDSILEQKPHCAVLLEKYTKTNCQHCFLSTIAPIGCPNCSMVCFCSNECRDIALSTYHAYECKLLPLIRDAGLPSFMQVALRMISQKPLQYFIDMKDQLTDNLKLEDTLKLSTDDYRTVFTLVRHENIRKPLNFLNHAIMANILTYYLRKVNYFSSININDNQFTEMYAFIGGLILRNLQISGYNVHGVSEFERLNRRRKLIKIGEAIYPTLSRFNHSCNPSIFKYFKGTSVHVRASKTIKPGEEIYENYGFIYTEYSYDERQRQLRDMFHFNCNCIPCTELWPKGCDMNSYKLKFKCAAGGDKSCENILILPANCFNSKEMAKCNKCNQLTDISYGIGHVKKMEMCLIYAVNFIERGELQKAAKKYCECLETMEDFMVIPSSHYCFTHQLYCECLMEHGNKNNFDFEDDDEV